jgi:hypothetical protein
MLDSPVRWIRAFGAPHNSADCIHTVVETMRLALQGDWSNPCHPAIVEFNAGVAKARADIRGYRYALAS